MNTETKASLRARIARAGGSDIGEIWPELFLSDTRGGILTLSFCNQAMPADRVCLLDAQGKATFFQSTGHN